MLLGLLELHHLSSCLVSLISLLYILLSLSCEPRPLVFLLLYFCYSIKSSQLSILLSNPYLTHIFLYQSSPKSLSLLSQVVEFLNLQKQVSQCLLSAQKRILSYLFYCPYFFSPLFFRFGAPYSEMTCFPTVIISSYLPALVHLHCIKISPRNVQNWFFLHIS